MTPTTCLAVLAYALAQICIWVFTALACVVIGCVAIVILIWEELVEPLIDWVDEKVKGRMGMKKLKITQLVMVYDISKEWTWFNWFTFFRVRRKLLKAGKK